MNRDQWEGNWRQVKGRMREQWGKLTDDDVDQISGKFERLVGKLQERYGYDRAQAEREAERWEHSL